MNEITGLASNPFADNGAVDSAPGLGIGGYELFGLGWSPESSASEYVGRHRSTDA